MKKKKRLVSLLTAATLVLTGIQPFTLTASADSSTQWNTSTSWKTMTSASKLSPGTKYFSNNEWRGTQNSTDANGNTVNQADIYQVNRLDYHNNKTMPYDSVEAAVKGAVDFDYSQSSDYQLLTGEGQEWQLAVYQNVDNAVSAGVDGNFYKTNYDMNSAPKYTGNNTVGTYGSTAYYGGFKSVTLPASWCTQGFDFPIYSNVSYPWDTYGNGTVTCPNVPTVTNPAGYYRRTFTVDKDWLASNRKVFISFQGVESCMYLYVNGYEVGYSEDTMDPQDFDITAYLNKDGSENVLAVKVIRWCDGSWLEDQDYLRLAGISRDVYLYSTPAVYISDYTTVTDLDDSYTNANLNLSIDLTSYAKESNISGFAADVQLYDAEGNNVLANDTMRGNFDTISYGQTKTLSLSKYIVAPHLWSDEDPYLYTLVINLYDTNGAYYESVSQQLGFREITFTSTTVDSNYNKTTSYYQNVLLNGKSFKFTGVDRHDTSPYTGHYVSHDEYQQDIYIMLQNNINAIRTSHYPDDDYLYYMCDKYGILVLSEANVESHGMDTENQATYLAAAVTDRLTSMIERLKNETCIVMWSYGNESGSTGTSKFISKEIMNVMKVLDTTRPIHYEGLGGSGGVDISSNMYAGIQTVASHAEDSTNMPYIECEYAHAMGSSVGNLWEYWEAFRSSDNILGGFIWDYVDQSIATELPSGTYDYYSEIGNEKLAGYYLGYGGNWGDAINQGDFCANGIISSDRTVQPEMAEVKYVYSDIQFTASTNDILQHKINITNYKSFSDLSAYDFKWELVEDGKTIDSGVFNTSIQPGATAAVTVPFTMPSTLKDDGEYMLNVYACLKESTDWADAGYVMQQDQFEVPAEIKNLTNKTPSGNISLSDSNGYYTITADKASFTVNKSTGVITNYQYNGESLVSSGPTANFWRGRLENDSASDSIDTKWRTANSNMTVNSINYSYESSAVKVVVSLTLPNAANSTMDITYKFWATGEVEVTSTLHPASSMGELLVYGEAVTLSGDYSNFKWYGNGPDETYNDRMRGSDVGIYKETVDEAFYPYQYTQASGNHVGVRYLTVESDSKNTGIMVVAKDTIEASVSRYTAEELENAEHPYELSGSKDKTVLNLNYGSRGVGGATCGPDTLTKYRMLNDGTDYTYSYTIVPYTRWNTDTTVLQKYYRDYDTFSLASYNESMAAEVDDLIEENCSVVLTANQKSLVEDARAAYELLTEDQKILVSNYSMLTKAEELLTYMDNAKLYLRDKSLYGDVLDVTDSVSVIKDESSPVGYAIKGSFPVNMDRVHSQITGTNSFTLTTWVNPSDLDDGNTFFSKGDTQVSLKTTSSSVEFCAYYDGNWNALTASSSYLTIGQWNHIAISYDGSNGNMKLYINGVLRAEKTGPSQIADNGRNAYVGAMDGYGGRELRGSLASSRLYSTVMSDDQIKQEYDADLGNGSQPIGLGSSSVVYWFDADAYSGTIAKNTYIIDQSSYGDMVEITGTAGLKKDESSPFGYAFEGYYPISADRVTSAISGTNSFTISVWVKPDDLADNNTFFAKGDTQVSIKTTATSIEFCCYYNGSWYDLTASNSLVKVGKWNMITASYNGSTKEMNLYINGSNRVTRTGPDTVNADDNTAYVGKMDGSTSRFLRGSMASFRMYGSAISEATVAQIYNADVNGTSQPIAENDSNVLIWLDADYNTDQYLGDGIELVGMQYSTTNNGVRIISTVEPIINAKKVVEYGNLFAMADKATESEMVADSSKVYKYASTSKGKLSAQLTDSDTACNYVMTLVKNGETAEALTTKYRVRPYAKLSDGTYVYGDTLTYNVYKLASVLYDNCQMQNKTAHDFLYDNILSVVDSAYNKVDYDSYLIVK